MTFDLIIETRRSIVHRRNDRASDVLMVEIVV